MDDLISRKMVLALPRNKVRSLRTYEVIDETINVTDIEHLPPAQPDHIAEVSKKVGDDLISRQAAIDAADRADYTGLAVEDVKKVTDEVVKELKQLPSVQPEPQWIPCSERLPKDRRQVLVYARNVHYALAKYDEMREADGTYKKQWVTFDAWKPYHTIKDVIKWMPLPEP